MAFPWKELPLSLRSKLLPGSVGKMHLTGLASAALQTGTHASLGADMLLAAWEADPLDGMLAGQLARFLPADGGGLRSLLDALAGLWTTDEYVLRLQGQGKGERMLAVLEDKLGSGPFSLFHLQRAMELGPAERDAAWAAGFLDRPCPGGVAPAVDYARAMLHLVGGDAERARDGFLALGESLPLPSIPARLGECEYRLGNRERALSLWREALVKRPWDVSLLLKAYDVAAGLDREVRPLDGPVDIFLYTFNKCVELDNALGALAGAGLDSARVTVLDNGCTDDTAAVLARWRADLGDRLEVISLPVNVGAPAARNWLMHRPGVEPHPWTVFLDDDAVVPEDWLGRLGSAVAAYPEAGVWGCKVVDGERPHVIQNADLHPRPDYGGEGGFKPGEMSDLHHQVPDAGGFDYLRPCASVTGCCHLFRTGTLLESGDFDLAFSPSQFDDLDHDLRLVLEGRTAVYQGHLPVLHMKRSGKLTQRAGAAFASGQANHDKLRARYAGEPWERVRAVTGEAVLRDLIRKSDALDGD
jgi:hypothetical protein